MPQPYRAGQNLCSSSCPIEHIDIPGNNIEEPKASWPDIRGLNSLNYSRDKWMTGDAIEVSIETYCRGLPRALRDKIGLGIPGINPKVWHAGPDGEDTLVLEIKASRTRALNRIGATPFSIFPICTDGDHWVLVVICKSRPHGTKRWSHVKHVAVLDPFRNSQRVKMVNERLRLWLIEGGEFTYSENYNKDVWVPLQNDATSCGARAYWNAKQLIDRLLAFYEAGIEYSSLLWNDLSGWFNEDFVRGEMMGRCAWAAVRAMDYNARIAVEYVNWVRDYEKTDGWKKADEMMKPADVSEAEPEKRPHISNIMALTPPTRTASILPKTPAGSRQHSGHDKAPVPNPLTPSTPTRANRRHAPRTPYQHKGTSHVTSGDNVLVVDDSSDDSDSKKAKSRTFAPAFPRSPFSPPAPNSTAMKSVLSPPKPAKKRSATIDFSSLLPPRRSAERPIPQTSTSKREFSEMADDDRRRKARVPGKHIIDVSDRDFLMQGPSRKRRKSLTDTGCKVM
ncbi:hypothetical protein F5Y01DRAFT_146513 [Xylaria sp. FL0043]|nr:hypothetical protein F5Y01DRAFT_146513 [Xylaria sp. FL0043]